LISNTLISVVGAALFGALHHDARCRHDGWIGRSRPQEGAVAKAAADVFDARLFAAAPGEKAYACFVRHYDADHLARHRKQRVSAMQLLVTAEMTPEDNTLGHSFRLGVKYRQRPGDFDCSGYCNHAVAENAGHNIRLDCEGGGTNVALSKDDKSAAIRLERITIWQRNKPDDEIFRLERVDSRDCAALVADGKELAAIGHK
jgi:hypothetical protein